MHPTTLNPDDRYWAGTCVCRVVEFQLNSHHNIYTISSLARFARSATPPYMSNPAPGQLSVQSCCSPIASIRFVTAVPRFRPLQLLLAASLPLRLLFPDFNSSPIACTSAAAPRLLPLQLQLPDCGCFDCCSPTASALTAAPRLHPPLVAYSPDYSPRL